ncbi:MAG: SgcJ/EcaC family oxidoreductase, partial [Dehalococcoidia bacterium]|nr:SgcJ/EcaC family oxidoreductase [Dehalococcoidia bacterium]
MTDETIDSELRRFVVQYEVAWATHDADVLSGLFTDDADIISGPEPRVAGRKAIREWWAAYFEHVEP